MDELIVLGVLVVLAVPVLLIVLLVMLMGVRARVTALEAQVATLRTKAATVAVPVVMPSTAATTAIPSTPARASTERFADAHREVVAPHAPPHGDLTPAAEGNLAPITVPPSPSAIPDAMPAAAISSSASSPPALPPGLPPRATAPPSPPSPPNVLDNAVAAVKRWFTEGNVPVKIGMLVLLAGVAALLKYASDQGWLRMPIEFRLVGIAVAALAALVFGWRQRIAKPSFALALQGGAIGALLLIVFAAFKLYALMPAGAAFAVSIVLIAGLGVLAVLQESRTLAVLGILAGFLAPIWLSTGSGNHVALFSYYAVLNAAIFAIAWVRPWRALNLLGFAFTWGIGIAWGVLQYDAAKYATTQPFLVLFFVFYLLLPILYARKRPAAHGDRIDGSLLFGTPLVAFSLQAALLHGDRMPLALCALGLAVLYAVLAAALVRRTRLAVLGQGYALLAVGFATLSIPLALSARATASAFALEGAGLVWLGLRQQRLLPRYAGLLLQVAAAFALVAGRLAWDADTLAVANPTFMGALLIAVAGFASAWTLRAAGERGLATLCYAWGLAWWCGDALQEVFRFVDVDARADVLLACAALTGWLAAEVQRRRPATALVLTTLGAFLLALPLAFAQADAHAHPFAGNGAWAWLAFAVFGVRSLLCLRGSDDRFAAWAQFAWWLVWPTAASLLATWIAQSFRLAQGWWIAWLALPWLAIALVSLRRWRWLSAPLDARFDPYRLPLQATVFGAIGIGGCLSLFAAGDSAPLPWVPALNPLELVQLAALALTARWAWSPQAGAPSIVRSRRIVLLSAAAFAWITCATLRTVHHWGGVPWDGQLVSSMLAQTSLTVVWSVLGVIGWIVGSRRGQRALWLAGAVLMGVVLAKLVIVDRQHLGNLLGIGSFIAYGLLCTMVGYFAPAPPRAPTRDDAAEAQA